MFKNKYKLCFIHTCEFIKLNFLFGYTFKIKKTKNEQWLSILAIVLLYKTYTWVENQWSIELEIKVEVVK